VDGSRFDAIVRNAAKLTRRATLGTVLTAALGSRTAAAQEVQAEICLPNGQRCGKKAGGRGRPCRKCCSNYAPKERGARHCACVPFGGTCGNSGQCCEGNCIQGKCGCRDDGETCRTDADCCFSGCNEGICQCLDDGSVCDDDLDCCETNCVQGLCQCLDDGETCDDDFDCCDFSCAFGVCGCRGDGETCEDEFDCCFTNCVQGLCQCFADGETCQDDFDCCFTNCVDGVCQCFAGGQACERDGDCCDTQCTDGVCVNPVCTENREVCNGGSEPGNPFCGFSDCICMETTGGDPFCGDFFNSPEECSGCSEDSDCAAVTGPGSACVVSEDCCELEGDEPATLCVAPCPEPGALSTPRHTTNRSRGPSRPDRRQRRKREKPKRRR
jgi:hypothetical protein